MPVYTLAQTHYGMQKVEVEIALVRGLPTMEFLGRPDSSIKETAKRLKMAFHRAGWNWPHHQQILVNLKPASLKKQSSGMDLAITVALKIAQGEWSSDMFPPDCIFYGEIDFEGRVLAPADLAESWQDNSMIVSGRDLPSQLKGYCLEKLEDPLDLKLQQPKPFSEKLKAPEINKSLRFSKQAADLLKICAVGEHHVLLCGAAGAGKSFWVQTLWRLLPEPRYEEFIRSQY
ncbi:MAG: ATP-binding protein, partial [Bdellovibrionales bacterium]|nr:ATP-binding protein [Bdellovibrionales bacterium]